MACQKVCKQGRDVVSQANPSADRFQYHALCVILKAIRAAGVGWVWLARPVGMMYESKGQRIGKAPFLHLFHTTVRYGA